MSTPQLLLSSINSIGFADGNIDAQSITAEVGFTLAGAGTFTINGNAGAEGQVIQISGGYPEWTTLTPPSTTTYAGVYTSPGGETSVDISVSTLTSTGVVMCSYLNVNSGGIYLGDVTPATDTFNIRLTGPSVNGDKITWQVVSLGTG